MPNSFDSLASRRNMARVVRKARAQNLLSQAEHDDWIADLQKPRGFWKNLIYTIFRI